MRQGALAARARARPPDGRGIASAPRLDGLGRAVAERPQPFRFARNHGRPRVLAEGRAGSSEPRVHRGARHGAGKPAEEILKASRAEHCDLIAMATHGHRLLSDLIYGTTITEV